MIGAFCFILCAAVIGILPLTVLHVLDARDERRRAERLARWYVEHGGGE